MGAISAANFGREVFGGSAAIADVGSVVGIGAPAAHDARAIQDPSQQTRESGFSDRLRKAECRVRLWSGCAHGPGRQSLGDADPASFSGWTCDAGKPLRPSEPHHLLSGSGAVFGR